MRRQIRIGALAGLALVAVAVIAGVQLRARPGSVATSAHALPSSASPIAADSFRSVRTYQTVSVPVRLRIPALHVDTRLQRLGVQADGTIAVPGSPDIAGWYERGPRPGQPGPAVILGHVDSQSGPGVFVNLRNVRLGTTVVVDRADGSTVTFRVTAVSRVAKTQFPTDLVYAPTLDPTLRLVTCGGSFDRARGSYRDNVIAYADRV